MARPRSLKAWMRTFALVFPKQQHPLHRGKSGDQDGTPRRCGGVETSPFTKHNLYFWLLLLSFASVQPLINKKKKSNTIFKLKSWGGRENAVIFQSSPMLLLHRLYLCSIKELG